MSGGSAASREGGPGEGLGRSSRSANRRWDAVLFDLDGTLADTVTLILQCYRHTMRTHLGEERPDADWLRTIGTPLREQLRAFARTAGEANEMFDTYVSFQDGMHDAAVRPFEGAASVLEAVAASGAAVAVVTSKRRSMAIRTLEQCGLRHLVPVLVSVDDVVHGKPDPEPVLHALDGLGLTVGGARVLFVGDSPFDIRAGKAAGVRTAAALWGPFRAEQLRPLEPDYVLEEIRSLYPLLA